MVSEGVRPHQGSAVIRGHLVSTDKPNIPLLETVTAEFSQIVQEHELHRTISCQFWGVTLGFCFVHART